MSISKAQARENRARVVESASLLFRERGYDGIGVKELMAGAGLTHGGFYNQFRSKSALMIEATSCGLSQLTADSNTSDFINYYLSRAHRDSLGQGCAIAALGSDAARQHKDIKSVFEIGIEKLISDLSSGLSADEQKEARAKAISLLAQAVGAIVLSRACPDDALLADEILDSCKLSLAIKLVL
ncbi:TetR/AcrR family transcriptional regulator [Pseudomonas sp. PCH199]|uniref:TetR/AcrR family transcriptional regulator n=1 Tax=unclassified Pseudomonas TaxID=196821 RepID=UPI000BC6A298|nr:MULTISPECIES: TetR/AcrR family transcriptional regulator [unclassified Pseudomonas]MCW8278658.1 TetR/AcrR family transcriptional regulator [Pseudomonas sp. PCH199]PAM81132.1 TetR family transcriptional regulator [Pseudomonas sp. ERMR1:02]